MILFGVFSQRISPEIREGGPCSQHNLEVEDSPDHLFLIATRRSPPLEDLKKLLGIEDFHDDPHPHGRVVFNL